MRVPTKLLLACALAAGLLMTGALALVRSECVRLTDAAFTERTLRSQVSGRLQNEVRQQYQREQQRLRIQNELTAELLKSLKSAKRYRSRRAVLGSIFRAVAKFQAAPPDPESRPAPVHVEPAGIEDARRQQETSVRRIEILTLICLISALSAGLICISLGRNLWLALRFVIAENDQAQAAAGEKTSSLLESMAVAATVIRDVSTRLAATPTHKPVTVMPPPAVRPAIDKSAIPPFLAAAETALTEIAQLTEAIRGNSSQTNILALNASIEAAHAGDRGAGFGMVAGEMKIQAAAFAESADQIGFRLTSIRSELKRVLDAVNALQAEKMAPVIVRIPGAAASIPKEIPECLTTLAEDLERFGRKQKQVFQPLSKPRRRKIK